MEFVIPAAISSPGKDQDSRKAPPVILEGGRPNRSVIKWRYQSCNRTTHSKAGIKVLRVGLDRVPDPDPRMT